MRGDVFTPGQAHHNHPPDPLMMKRVTLKRDIRQEAVRDVHAPANRVVDEKMVETFNTREDFNLPRPATLVRTMNRARKKLRPQEPKTLDFEVNTDYIGPDFYVGDVTEGDERHLIFATPHQLDILQTARRWYLDGTFRVISKPFTQLWSIHAFIRQGNAVKQVPLLFVMMSRRRKIDYVAVLNKVKDVLPDTPLVESFTMDFEAGMWQVLREVFPGASLHGCGFHWAQAVQRHVGQVGLQATYQRREGAHQHIRKLLALPFLPARDIPRAFRKLREKVTGTSAPLEDLFQYVEDQWLESSLWSPDEWSVYRRPIRTNNDTEGWHRRMNAKAGRVALSMYVLVTMLKREACLVDITAQLVSEEAILRNRREVYVNMDAAIWSLWEEYDHHEVVCEEFLRKIAEVYQL